MTSMCFVLRWLWLWFILFDRTKSRHYRYLLQATDVYSLITNIVVFKLWVLIWPCIHQHTTYNNVSVIVPVRYCMLYIDEYWRHIKSFSNCKFSIKNLSLHARKSLAAGAPPRTPLKRSPRPPSRKSKSSGRFAPLYLGRFALDILGPCHHFHFNP